MGEMQVWSLGWEDPLRGKWLPTPVFLPGEFHRQRSLVGYSPWRCKCWTWLKQLSTLARRYIHVCATQGMDVLVMQLCPTLCDLMDCSLPGSSVHGILQARILEWVDIPFSRGSSWPSEWTQVSCTAGRFFTVWAMECFTLIEEINTICIGVHLCFRFYPILVFFCWEPEFSLVTPLCINKAID